MIPFNAPVFCSDSGDAALDNLNMDQAYRMGAGWNIKSVYNDYIMKQNMEEVALQGEMDGQQMDGASDDTGSGQQEQELELKQRVSNDNRTERTVAVSEDVAQEDTIPEANIKEIRKEEYVDIDDSGTIIRTKVEYFIGYDGTVFKTKTNQEKYKILVLNGLMQHMYMRKTEVKDRLGRVTESSVFEYYSSGNNVWYSQSRWVKYEFYGSTDRVSAFAWGVKIGSWQDKRNWNNGVDRFNRHSVPILSREEAVEVIDRFAVKEAEDKLERRYCYASDNKCNFDEEGRCTDATERSGSIITATNRKFGMYAGAICWIEYNRVYPRDRSGYAYKSVKTEIKTAAGELVLTVSVDENRLTHVGNYIRLRPEVQDEYLTNPGQRIIRPDAPRGPALFTQTPSFYPRWSLPDIYWNTGWIERLFEGHSYNGNAAQDNRWLSKPMTDDIKWYDIFLATDYNAVYLNDANEAIVKGSLLDGDTADLWGYRGPRLSMGNIGDDDEGISGVMIYLAGKTDRSAMEEGILALTSAAVENTAYIDAQTLQEFEASVKIALDSLAHMDAAVRGADIRAFSISLAKLVEEKKLISAAYLAGTESVYEELAGLLGVDVEKDELPDIYAGIKLTSMEKRKILVDIAINGLKARQDGLLTDNERKALDTDRDDLESLRSDYTVKIKAMIDTFTAQVRTTLKESAPVTVGKEGTDVQVVMVLGGQGGETAQ